MRKQLSVLSSLVFIAACSAPAILEVPPVPKPPANWSQFSTTTLPGSSCPNIAGQYSEPPVIYPSEENAKASSNDNTGSLYRNFPFHLADRKELAEGEYGLTGNRFLIRQPNSDSFYFSFVTTKKSIVEYHFRAVEGDFECKGGYIQFPINSSYGMVEGMSVNSQIRNVVLRENGGALIVQKTIGPYRGDPLAAGKKFTYEFVRYPLYGKPPRED